MIVLVNKLVNIVGSFPRQLLGSLAINKTIRELFHFVGGMLVAGITCFNVYVQVSVCLIALAIIIYGEFGDVKDGSPRWQSYLDVTVWLLGMGTSATLIEFIKA